MMRLVTDDINAGFTAINPLNPNPQYAILNTQSSIQILNPQSSILNPSAILSAHGVSRPDAWQVSNH
jgi:hypothetical protein